ncbi:MAG: GspE/PulE family protein [Candidatus Riflebacteria bacterium]
MARLISTLNSTIPLDQILENQGLFSRELLNEFIEKAAKAGQKLEEFLVKSGQIDEPTAYQALAESFSLGFSRNPEVLNEAQAPERLKRICNRERLLIKSADDKKIELFTCEPEKVKRFAPLFLALGFEPIFLIAPPSAFAGIKIEDQQLKKNQDLFTGISSLADSLKSGPEVRIAEFSQNDIAAESDSSSLVELVNKTLLLAVNQQASDIHVESNQGGARVRFRIDGVLTDRFQLDSSSSSTFISRLLIMSNLDITEKVMPQDGSFKVKSGEQDIEFRIASMPGIYGQNLVLRLLTGISSQKLSLSSLGMMPDELSLIKSETRHPHGMILVAGPTGSGKSTTLYALLEEMADPRLKFITIEDPVERRIEGVQQIQVRINRNEPERSLTFARGLRTVLRLDPDIIMVGEIRDTDTAQISIQASLTGHLVLSTVHANSSVETLRRLENIGIDFHLLMSSLNLIFSQRLVRKLCHACRIAREPSAIEADLLCSFDKSGRVFEPAGCPNCLQTGYRGRAGIFEFLPFDESIKDLITGSGLTECIEEVRKRRLRTLLNSGLQKVAAGMTNFDELERVCGPCR